MIRAVIFDFDGLIVDTESPIFQAYAEVFEQHGCELTLSEWVRDVGGGATAHDTLALLEQRLGHSVDRAAVDTARRIRQAALVAEQPLLPGVTERITEAHRLGLKLGVASSSSREWVTGHLERFGLLPQIHAVRCRTDPDVGVSKPDPAAYRAVLRALGLDASEAIALEDSTLGVQAAASAGIFTVAVPNDITRPTGVLGADLTIDSLADMSIEWIVQIAEARASV